MLTLPLSCKISIVSQMKNKYFYFYLCLVTGDYITKCRLTTKWRFWVFGPLFDHFFVTSQYDWLKLKCFLIVFTKSWNYGNTPLCITCLQNTRIFCSLITCNRITLYYFFCFNYAFLSPLGKEGCDALCTTFYPGARLIASLMISVLLTGLIVLRTSSISMMMNFDHVIIDTC